MIFKTGIMFGHLLFLVLHVLLSIFFAKLCVQIIESTESVTLLGTFVTDFESGILFVSVFIT